MPCSISISYNENGTSAKSTYVGNISLVPGIIPKICSMTKTNEYPKHTIFVIFRILKSDTSEIQF